MRLLFPPPRVLALAALPLAAACAEPYVVAGPDTAAPVVSLADTLVVTDSASVVIEGTITDSVWVKAASYQVGDGPEQTLPIRQGRSVSFRVRLTLRVGWSEVRIFARDQPLNQGEAKVRVLRDLEPPSIRFLQVPPWRLADSVVRYRVEVRDEGGLGRVAFSVNGGPEEALVVPCASPRPRPGCVFETAGEVSGVRAGPNEVVFTADDWAGRRGRESLKFEVEPVRVESPAADSSVSGASVRLRGTVSFVAPILRLAVRVNAGPERALPFPPGKGAAIDAEVPLEVGGNAVEVLARFATGDTARVLRRVERVGAAAPGPFAAVAVGTGHTCALAADGRAFCWGARSAGKLGDGRGGSGEAQAVPVAVAGGYRFRGISARASFTCGVEEGGAVLCWGGLPAGGTDPPAALVPTPVPGAPPMDTVVAGESFACGLSREGLALCWGRGPVGPLARVCGNPGTPCSDTPVAVSPTIAFRALAAGKQHACGVAVDGRVFCWGRNYAGVFGTGVLHEESLVPVPAASGEVRFRSVSTGEARTCAVSVAGTAYCWGVDRSGRGSLTPRPLPGAPEMVQLSVGHSWVTPEECGVAVDGRALCWISGASVPVGGEIRFRAVASGYGHDCGVATSGAAFCWGSNEHGQLGYGGTEEMHMPTQVRNP